MLILPFVAGDLLYVSSLAGSIGQLDRPPDFYRAACNADAL